MKDFVDVARTAPAGTKTPSRRLRILHLIASVDPVGGGPVEYARVMAEAHARAGHSSTFVSLDAPDATFLRAFPARVLGAGPKGPGGIAPGFGPVVAKAARQADVAVIHGLWNWATMGGTRALRRAGLPWVTFPHGMLDPYFRRAKPLKHPLKQAVWSLMQGRALSRAQAVLFTCAQEQHLAQGAFRGHRDYPGRVVTFCASDMAQVPPDPGGLAARLPGLKGRDYLLYLSRIHPKKACDQLIEAFAAVAARASGLDLVIAGPDQTGWTPDLQKRAARLGVAARLHWPGMLEGGEKAAAYAGARAFVLPSHQENFGLVVAEALSVGTPVLVSDKVNIWREITASGAGLVAPDTVAGTTDLLARFLDLGPGALKQACRPCYAAYFSVARAARDLEQLLLQAVQAGPGRP